MADNTKFVWKDRKRILFGLPWTFTTYKLTEEKLLVSKGLFSTTEEEVRLYRILDLTHKRKLWQKLFGLGTIHCCSADHSTPEFDILNIKDSYRVKELLSDLVEVERDRKRVANREYMTGDNPEEDFDDLIDQH